MKAMFSGLQPILTRRFQWRLLDTDHRKAAFAVEGHDAQVATAGSLVGSTLAQRNYGFKCLCCWWRAHLQCGFESLSRSVGSELLTLEPGVDPQCDEYDPIFDNQHPGWLLEWIRIEVTQIDCRDIGEKDSDRRSPNPERRVEHRERQQPNQIPGIDYRCDQQKQAKNHISPWY